MANADLTAELLRELLDYAPETGVFTWKQVPKRNLRQLGQPAGCSSTGYRAIKIRSKSYLAHRLAWLYVHGYWPNVIDHINGDPLDNRIANLRNGDQQQNMQNKRRAPKNSASGLVGVHKHPSTNLWRASLKVDGKSHHLGYFKDAKDARSAYLEAKLRLHKGAAL